MASCFFFVFFLLLGLCPTSSLSLETSLRYLLASMKESKRSVLRKSKIYSEVNIPLFICSSLCHSSKVRFLLRMNMSSESSISITRLRVAGFDDTSGIIELDPEASPGVADVSGAFCNFGLGLGLGRGRGRVVVESHICCKRQWRLKRGN